MLCPQGNMQSCSLKSANTFQIIIFCYCSSLHDVLNFIPENSIPCATNGDVYLTGGSTDSEGTVQLCYNNEWGTVCDNGWTGNDADVVCRQLGYLSEWQETVARCHCLGYVYVENLA